ncbi:MAG: glycosyltransferase family 4 protein [Candidatus Freyarchaeota archaeon]|nr:glycosyltransferase family 4 protein [Candidatus Jordarchaeia archaeon]
MMERRVLHVLVISSGFYPKVDGTTLAVANLIEGLKTRGHKVSFITRKYKGTPSLENWRGTCILRVGPSGASAFSRLMLIINQVVLGIPFMISGKMDVIHDHGFAPLATGLILGFMFRKPVVATFHGFQSLWSKETRWRKEYVYKIAHPFFKLMIKSASAVIAQSKKLKEIIITTYDANPDKVYVIPHMIDEGFFSFSPKPRIDKNIVLYVGTLARVYGLDLLIEAAGYVRSFFPNCEFLIVGEGPQREKLEKLVKKSNLEEIVHFAGPIYDRKKLSEQYRSAKVVVIPEKYEGYILPLVALEALASGRPVITTLNLDPRAYEAGVIKTSFDPRDIAEKILWILRLSEDQYMEITEKARKFFEDEHGRNVVLRKIEELYLKFISR